MTIKQTSSLTKPSLITGLSYQKQILVETFLNRSRNLVSVSVSNSIVKEAKARMSPILYHNEISPPSRAALLTIRNLGLDVEVKHIDTYKGEQNTPEFLKVNPLHEVPAYVDGDFILTESRAISCYLAASAKSKLYPKDLKKRALVDSRLYFDATSLFPGMKGFAHLVLRAGAKKISEDRREAVKVLLNTLESFLANSLWFAGDELTVADLAICANVTTIKMWGVNLSDLPKLNDWYTRCEALPGFKENQDGAQVLANKLVKLMDEPVWK